MKKRLTGILLTLLMVISLLPMQAAAADDADAILQEGLGPGGGTGRTATT